MPKSIHSPAYRLFCTLIIKRRKEIGLSQYALAERLKRPQSFVAKIEGGERRIDVVEFLDIAHALDIDPCEILRAIEPPYHTPQKNEDA